MSLSLFSTKPEESGFRLISYEVYNWGTFDHTVWSINPDGETSLLTGANASGKTTLIDGLLTLLVPEKRMRFYNQTAGNKGERTEESYVTGEFGETENEETNTREIKKLRPEKNKAQSVLLAVFQNENHFVTLAQCRWFAGNELKRAFITAHVRLSVTQDFAPFDSGGEWKKRLKSKYPRQGTKEVILFPDGPGEYGRQMRKIFGMRSEKAHTLFSQTIGLKVLGNLDEFVRTQMLEERDAESEFQKIKEYFKTLYDAHRAIEKAHEQIKRLKPIREKGLELSLLNAEALKIKNWQDTLPLWFALRQELLLHSGMTEENSEHAHYQEQLNQTESKLAELNNRERDLDMNIRNDEAGRRIAGFEEDIRRLEFSREERDQELKKYNALAASLDLQENPMEEMLFTEQLHSIQKRKKEIQELNDKKRNDEIQEAIRIRDLKKEFNEISDELKILRAQKNNITGRVAEIRQEILEVCGATEKEIPFIGELIMIREDEKDWEPAIEKLLHNFALRLIIPEKYYQQVNAWVNQNNLRGRIVYHKYTQKSFINNMISTEENSVCDKLEFRKDTPYREWVEFEIKKNYNYLCTDDLEIFGVSDKAITQNGLIRTAGKHEKDDRQSAHQRQQFVLGWDNKQKIASIREHLQKVELSIRESERRSENYLKQIKKLQEESDIISTFTGIDHYRKIDIWSLTREIQELKNKISELQKSNNRIQTLKKQWEEVKQEIKILDIQRDQHKNKLQSAESKLNQYKLRLTQCREVISRYEDTPAEKYLSGFEKEYIGEHLPTLEQMDALQNKIRREIDLHIFNIREKQRVKKSETESLMREYKHPVEDDIFTRFEDWKSETHLLPLDADYIDQYIQLLEKIEGQELAEYKQKFKKYLNEEMITRMSDFKGWLDTQEEDILQNIETLNKSLNRINFKSNPPTFISLIAEKDYAPRVKDFRFRLNDWKPNIAEYQRTQDDKILEESFSKIRALLDDLTEDENMRKEVLDVRNWLKFKAAEHHREDPKKIFRSYTGTAKLSGGEGAQLTYTILGSAIAYQFGIHSEGLNTDSFRFICVDEAFSKQDDEKARFLMELCRQLHLQLMVVSPAKAEEVAIVEPYIARVHFVQRQNNRNSVVYDMSIKQLQDSRQEFFEKAEA